MADLSKFLADVDRSIDELVGAASLDEDQRALLVATLRYQRRRINGNPFGDPLVFFYLVCRAAGASLDERATRLGAFCLLYICALDLLDDVQDQDLAGKPHAEAGPAIALNSGLTLFALALAELHDAMALEHDAARARAYLGLFTRICIDTSAGQHRDLLGAARSLEEVLAMHRAKTSSIVLVVECAAMHAEADPATLTRFREAAENMAVLIQVAGDVRDIFGKPLSPDLIGDKHTYPLVAFRNRATAEQTAEFVALASGASDSPRRTRELLYEAGAVGCSAEAIEQSRRRIHAALAGIGSPHPALRTWLLLIDGLASLIYVPPLLAESRALLQPEGAWHRKVRGLAAEFARNLRRFEPPPAPAIIPWGSHQWMYDPKRKALFYPDIEDHADEIWPPLAALYGSDDLEAMRALIVQQAPVVMAHEMFHWQLCTCQR